MTKVLLALTLSLSASSAFAAQQQPGVGYGGGTGALAQVTRDLATSPDEVRRQGGFATPGAVHWTKAPASHTKGGVVSF